MENFKISLMPFFVFALTNFVLSWIYYSPLVPWFKDLVKNINGITTVTLSDRLNFY